MIAVYELGLQDTITLERVVVSARDVNPDVLAINPLNKIPTLILDDGITLFDSPVIIEYLDSTRRLLPAEPARRWPALRLQALGDGICQLNVARLAEQNRGETASVQYVQSHRTKTDAALDFVEHNGALQDVTAGTIAVAAALSHLDFRFPDHAWRERRPHLAAWFAAFSDRPSMRATEFRNVY